MKKINTNGVTALAKDVEYLAEFVDSLNVPILRENLDELQQTVQLMQADSADEFYDISTRNKKYGRVDAIQGPVLLEKCVFNPFAFCHLHTDCLLSGLPAMFRLPPRPTNSRNCLRASRRLDNSKNTRTECVCAH